MKNQEGIKMTEVFKTKSGINIIFDELSNISTCSVGVFVKTGSKDEADNEEGISHVLEHMIFKGTPSRNYFQISEETDYLGSSINAHTTKEQTVFFINALSEYLNETLDILFDIVVNSTIDKDELEKEKDVIIEEIRMYKDSPDDLVSELNVSDAVSGQYGKPIIGTEESVRSFTPEMIKKYYKERYTKDNIAISVSGKFNKEQIIAKVEEYFGKLDEVKTDRRKSADFDFNAGRNSYTKDINQVNICISHKGLSIFDEDKIYVNITSGVIGGSMSSRLFQEIREKKGLAYSVYTYNQNFSEGGVLSTYIGTNKESYEEAIEITLKEFKKLREEGITENELQKAKNKQLSRMAFSMENPNSRMYIFGNHFIKKGKLFDVKEFENDVKRVEVEKINKFLKNMFTVENITILGNV